MQQRPWLDRIEDLLMKEGEESILEGLRRTAPWLSHNPLMKMERENRKLMSSLGNLYHHLGNMLLKSQR